jgi:phosphoribosylformylglycinamidine cyclo-ligase
MAHITGGGILHNLSRVLPDDCDAELIQNWDVQPIFNIIQEAGNIKTEEMYKVFNMGIGFIVIASTENIDPVYNELVNKNQKVYEIGEIKSGNGEAKWQK